MVGLAAALLLSVVPACSSSDRTVARPVEAEPAGGEQRRLTGRWTHVDAAVAYAASRSEMAVLSSSRDGKARSATFSLVTIADRPATLALRQDPAADPDQPAEILAVAVVGRFGDPAREAALLRDLQRRLDQLEERGWAPIPE